MSLAVLDRNLVTSALEQAADPQMRQVFLDHLEEQGVALAPLYRLRAKLQEEVTEAEKATLGKQLEELVARVEVGWRTELHGSSQDCELGDFLLLLTMTAFKFSTKAFQQKGANWFREAGLVSLRLRAAKKYLPKFADASALAEVAVLDISWDGLGDRDVAALTACRHLGNLVTLSLRTNAISDSGARALANCPALVKLAHLRLQRNGIRDGGALALVQSPHLKGLRVLDLRGNPIVNEAELQRLCPGVLLGEPDPESAGNPDGQWYFRGEQDWVGADMVSCPLFHKRVWHLTRDEEPRDVELGDEVVGAGEEVEEIAESSFMIEGDARRAYAVLNRLGMVDVNTLYQDGVLERTVTVGGVVTPVRFVCDTQEIREAVEAWLVAHPTTAGLEALRGELERLNEDWHVEVFERGGVQFVSVLERGVFLTLPPLPPSHEGRL